MAAKKSRFMLGFIVLGLVMFFVLSSASDSIRNSFSVFGYPSAFQGPKVWFTGEEYNGKQYNQTPNTVLSFNPDGANNGKPAIYGEMTTIFHPSKAASFAGFPWWNPVPASYTQNLGLYANGWNGSEPAKNYTWTIDNNVYYMAQYEMKYYVSFSSAPTPFDGNEDPNHGIDPLLGPSHTENVYNNLKIWFQIDTEPTWYIEGGGTAYCAIAKIQLGENVVFKSKDVNGVINPARTSVQTVPMSQPSNLMVYYAPWGGEPTGDITPATYQGKKLNSNYFRNTTYFYVNLADFGVSSDAVNFLTTLSKGDVATFCFQVTVFVIGDYTVQDIQEDPNQYGRFTPTGSSGGGVIGWLLSPTTLAWLIPVLIIAAIFIFAPWLIVALIALFKG